MKKLLILFIAFVTIPLQTLTAQDNNVSCGDLLEMYATTNKHLSFISCDKQEKPDQLIAEALYKVKGENIDEIIQFFKAKDLKYLCCGWETEGDITVNEKLKALNNEYSFMVSIYSNETINNSDPKKEKYFNVIVRIVWV